MNESSTPSQGRLARAWRWVERAVRLALALSLLVLLVLVLMLLLGGRGASIPGKVALVVAPQGVVVEQLWGTPSQRAVAALLGQERPETLLQDMVEALEAARDDERVKVVLLELDRLLGAGLSKLQVLGEAVRDFQTSGKPVLASGDFYTQSQYYLASLADEVYLHPMGMVLLTGYGSYRNYYKEALDRWEVHWNVFRVGEYKSAPEPYLRSDMSPAARQALAVVLDGLWRQYRADVAAARGVAPETLAAYASEFADRLAVHSGDAAALAQAEGLVDEVAGRDRVRDRLIELVGLDGDEEAYPRIEHGAYLRSARRPPPPSDNVVAVIVASGEILDGTQPPGVVGGDSTAALIRGAREDEDVKAIVLRVDSPGGSALAAEIIRRELELTREAGKPVVASMSSVAASGGYWISMSADEIWAQPTTLTGSIGIYAMIPTFEGPLARLGVRNDGVGTGPLAGTLRPDRGLPPEAARAAQLLIDQGYRMFLDGAAEGRGMSVEQVDAVARGRVWTGEDGQRLGLVDRIGDLGEAIAAAAERAGVADDHRVVYYERRAGLGDRLLGRLVSAAAGRVGPAVRAALPALAGGPEFGPAGEALRTLAASATPERPGLLAYCFCEPN